MSSPQPAPVVSVIKKDVPASHNAGSLNSRRRNDVITSTDSQWNGMVHNNLRENAAKEILQDVQRYCTTYPKSRFTEILSCDYQKMSNFH
jgi:hypothetical protein